MASPTSELPRYRTPIRRTPVVLQMEAVECGAASLAMILAYHGRVVPLAELRTACAVSRDGSNAANIVRAAKSYGLEARGYSKDLEGLQQIEGPSIVFWRFNHFLVVEGFRGDTVLLNDPAVGHVRVPLAEFDEGFTGVVLAFQPGPDFVRAGRPPNALRALRERLEGFRAALVYAVLAGFLLVLPGLALPALTQVFVDEVLIEGRRDWMPALLFGLAATAAAVGILRTLQLTVLRRMRLAVSARLSTGFFQHLLRLPVEFYAQRFAGEVARRRRLNERVAAVLSGRLTQTFIDVVMMVFYLLALMLYDLRLAGVAALSATLLFAALRWLSRRRVEANMRVLQEYGKVAATAISGLQSIETLKASGLEDGFFRRWSGHFARASNARQEMELANQPLGVLPGLLFGLTNVAVLALGGWSVIEGRLTVGQLIAIQLLTGSFLGPVGSLVGLGQTLQDLRGDLTRLDDVLDYDTDPQAPDALDSSSVHLDSQVSPRLAGRLEFRSVSFGYGRAAPPLVEDFDLILAPGKRVALVGGSGSGKSTLAQLAAGLQRPWTGEVLVDGAPRGQHAPERICASLSWVDQDVVLFAGSVRDNLTLWDDTVPDRVLIDALRDAELLERVQALPGGLDGELEEGGANLSGGERQRLEIARALVGDPSILILDEATSALDAESERAIVERIALRGSSCLIVAHRLSTVRDCDEILLLERGRVLERGTHAELWAARGAYYELVRLDVSPDDGGAA